MAPPFPPAAVLDPIDTLPEVPELVVPELNTSSPLAPVAPALTVMMMTAPLVDPAL
jgi:hypothetical protein